MRCVRSLLLFLLMSLFGFADGALADERVALIIGNSAYRHSIQLRNPKNDAEAIAQTLRKIGFTSVTLKTDQTANELRRLLKTFEARAARAETALVFFAGHGMELGGENYLIPIDARVQHDKHLRREAVGLKSIMRAVGRASRLGLIILDACRTNPFAARMKVTGKFKRAVSRGFKRPSVEEGDNVLVAYAARHGTVADDGEGRHSPYTKALLSHLSERGVDIRLALGKVRDAVMTATRRKQVPHIYGTLGGHNVYLNPPEAETEELPSSTGNMREAAIAWNAIKHSRRATDLKTFIKRYPASFFADLARTRLEELSVAVGVPPGKPPAVNVLEPGTEFQDCRVCPKMVVLPAGRFTMGSPEDEKGRYDDEGPQRHVTIARRFSVGKYEVTFDEWDACVADRGCRQTPADQGWGRGSRPVINISWGDAKAYVAWLSQKTGKTYRLLSEAEWEFAARAGTTTPFAAGWTITPLQANYESKRSQVGSAKGLNRNKTVAVGRFAANGFGLHDMNGNVWEWVTDCWNGTHAGAATDGTPRLRGDCLRRVVRGGAWGSGPKELRSALRHKVGIETRDDSLGLRVARELAE